MLEFLAQTSSEIPLFALFSISIALFAFLYLMVRLGMKWRQQKSQATLNLFLTFTSYFIAIFFVLSTKITDFLTNDLYQVSTIGINLGYSFSLIGNVFLFYFTENIFFEKRLPYLRESITFGNGITFGFLTIHIIQVQSFPFLEIPGTYIPPQLLIWHVIISSLGFFILLVRAFTSSLRAKVKFQRVGFFMIALTAVFELLVFVFLFIDRFLGASFSVFYFAGWLSASIAGFLAMIGYLMPNWFKQIIGT